MSNLKNRVQLIGNLGADPEVLDLDGGKKLVKFSIAVNETYKKDGENKSITNWFNVTSWGKLAEIAEKILNKGDEIAIEGKLTTRSYEDKEGNKRYVTEINASELLKLSGKNNTEAEEKE